MTTEQAASTAISVRGLSRTFGATRALHEVSMDVARGSVHALVGENGAGKSTCLGVLAGRISPSSGNVHLFGTELAYGRPRAIRAAGLVAVYQELTVVPGLTALANVFLGQTISRRGLLAERTMRREYDMLSAELGVAIPAGARAGDLSVADQQILEIMRGLRTQPRAILFDEPTASLAAPERASLYRVIRDLRGRGLAVVVVTHSLDEVLDHADHVTVFRDGQVVADQKRAHWDKPTLVRSMLGDSSETLARVLMDEGPGSGREEAAPTAVDAPMALTANALSVPGVLHDVAVNARRGEIVGLGGLVGSGRTTLLRALAGLEPTARGDLIVNGQRSRVPRTVRAARRMGLALLPEDRKRQGLVLGLSAAENITLGATCGGGRAGTTSQGAMVRSAAASARGSGFDVARLRQTARTLSGGNQQKLLIARLSRLQPTVLLADEPTRGIDIGAKQEIYDGLRRLAATGAAVIVVSSELEELAAISDRVFVLSDGRIVAELDRSRGETNVAQILDNAFGVNA